MTGGVTTIQLFEDISITTSGTSTSRIIDLENDYPAAGYFSFQILTSGAGVLRGTYSLSNDGENYQTPASASSIFTSHAAGLQQYSFAPMVAGKMKIALTETGTSGIIVRSGCIAIR